MLQPSKVVAVLRPYWKGRYVLQPFSIPSLRRGRIALAAAAALSGLLMLGQPAAVAAGAAQSDEDPAYVLLSPGSRSTTMSGSTADLSRARALRAGQEGLLYVRQGGQAYVIRDAETLRRAQAIFAPQEALGARQAELGSRQAALGSRQAALGAEQGRLGVRQASGTPREAEALASRQLELGRQQEALGAQQDALGRRQDQLGREQDRLGRQAEESFRALVADAIQRGLAERTSSN